MAMMIPRTGRLRGREGFSLVEVMLALMIGSVGLLALAGVLTYVLRSNREATDLSIATALARQRLEQVKLTEYNYVQDLHEYYLNENGVMDVQGGKYNRVTEVLVDQPAHNTKTVKVTVYYSPHMMNPERKAEVSTIIYP